MSVGPPSSLSARMRANAGVRIVLLAGGTLAVLYVLQRATGAMAHRVPASARPYAISAAEILICAAMIAAYRGGVRWLERRIAAEIAFAGALRRFLPGLLLGATLFSLVYAALWALGVAHAASLGGTAGLLGAFATSCAAAVGEEIIFRGALFRIIDERLGTAAAIALSAILFGLLHAANHGATMVSTAAIALEAGVLLAAAYAWARSLWLPIGLHLGWNFTEGGIFGAAVSGMQSTGLLHFSLSGPDLYTGGAFGPEASVVAVAICLAAAVGLIWMTVRRRRWRPFQLRAAPRDAVPVTPAGS